jgi:hypothetical protein
MDKAVKMVGVVLLALIPAMLSAEYAPQELFVITWGEVLVLFGPIKST